MKTLWERKQERAFLESGFSLIELMITVAIIAILASVALPAYINHVRRSRQSDAVVALMKAHLEQEVYYDSIDPSTGIEHYNYASAIACLPSFNDGGSYTGCLTNCGACTLNTYSDAYYSISVIQANSVYFRIQATRTDLNDILIVTANTAQPIVLDPGAIKFSFFQWAFD